MSTDETGAGGGGTAPGFPEHLPLPFLTTIPAVRHALQAFDVAFVGRTGAVLVGDKGVGKSGGLGHVLKQFAASDRLRVARDPAHRRQRVLALSTLRATQYREALLDVLDALAGSGYRDRVRGRVRTKDELRHAAADLLLDLGIVVVVVDEAETATDPVLEALRDLMVETRERDPARTASAATGAVVPAGVGVLLAGTHDFTPRILESNEAGQRYTRLIPVEPTPGTQAPAVYREWLPGFEPHVAVVGERAWAGYVRRHVTEGRAVPIGRLAAHVREYVRELARHDPEHVVSRETVYFVERTFERTWRSTGWADGTGGGA